MACVDEDVVECLGEGVLACLDKYDKDNVYAYFLLVHLLEYLLEEILCGKCLVHHGYMQEIV